MVGRRVIVNLMRYGAPAVPSTIVSCARCGDACWLSKRAELEPGDVLVCVVCAMAIVAPGDLLTPAPWVMADLSERSA